MKVLFLTNVPSPYRVEFFNQLGRECDLTVLYQKGVSSERDSKWKGVIGDHYKTVFMKGKSTGVDNAFCPEVLRYLADKSYDKIIICGIASPTEVLAIEWCKLHRRAYCLESDGGFAKDGKGIKEHIKRHIVKGAQVYFSTGAEHDKYYIMYGAPKEKLVRYPFSSLTEDDILNRPIEKKEKQELKHKLGITEEKMVLAVGQFIPRKGFDILLSVANQINAGIYIVGGIPTAEYSSMQLPNVHFEGFKTKEELKEYYMAADVFAHPTREDIWGLVVNEAMAVGLPVVTTNRCIAGREMVIDGRTGYIIESEDKEALCRKLNEALALNVDNNSLNKAREYTIEKMVKCHMLVFSK